MVNEIVLKENEVLEIRTDRIFKGKKSAAGRGGNHGRRALPA